MNRRDGQMQYEKKRIIGFYDYTVILTYLGMCCAFVGILCVMESRFSPAVGCLLLAGGCDMFDGLVAATKNRNKTEKRFGIQIDSLADLISFGIFPALFVYKISEHSFISSMIECLYVLCALIRLAYYNVQEEERQDMTEKERECFLGLPVTSIATLLPIVYFMYLQKVMMNRGGFVILLLMTEIGFITGVEVERPKLFGKVLLILVGTMEMFYTVLMMRMGI